VTASERWLPLEGKGLVAHWEFVVDVDNDMAGAFVTGQILLRGDGPLMRRYSRSTYADGHTTYRYGPWAKMKSWPGGTDADANAEYLRGQGFRLAPPLVPIDEPATGPVPGAPGEIDST